MKISPNRFPTTFAAPLVVVAVCAYAAAILAPFEFELPRQSANAAELLPGGGYGFSDLGIARSDTPPRWVAAVTRTHELTIVLRLQTNSSEQGGPARIMTLSQNWRRRNITIGQEKKNLVLRVRTPQTNLNELPAIVVPNVFQARDLIDVEVQIKPRSLSVKIGGQVRVNSRLPSKPLSNWDLYYKLALGNEVTTDRPWLGQIHSAVVTTADTSVDYAIPGFLKIPPRIWAFHNAPNLVPFQIYGVRDGMRNLFGYVPVGIVFGIWGFRQVNHRAGRMMALILLMSVSLETLQVFVPQRYPDINDAFLNTLGGGLGLLMVKWLFIGKLQCQRP